MQTVGIFPTELRREVVLAVRHVVFPALVQVAVKSPSHYDHRVAVQSVRCVVGVEGSLSFALVFGFRGTEFVCELDVFCVPAHLNRHFIEVIRLVLETIVDRKELGGISVGTCQILSPLGFTPSRFAGGIVPVAVGMLKIWIAHSFRIRSDGAEFVPFISKINSLFSLS